MVKGYSTLQVGMMIAVVPIGMGLTAPISGALSDRFGSRVISLIGLLIVASACVLISTLTADVDVVGYLARTAPLGVGIGFFQSPNNSAIMGAAPRQRLGVASGLLALSRTLGQTTGIPLMGALFAVQVMAAAALPPGADVTAAPPEALVAGVTGVFRTAALFILASTALAAFALWFDRRGRKAASFAERNDAVSVPSGSYDR
ncbi:MAG: MFS transporter [Anaerolineae bacterium]|nr:MFS transporter [Anaerolineae bacterium]